MAGLVAYNPNDPAQAGFLAALAQGETGGAVNSAFTGTGGANLSGLSSDQYGFPSWTGLGNSHAAGTFQFQPGTWDAIASQFNLNFQNPQDQAEGAWYLAQQTYAQKNNGASLETALNTPADYGSVQSSLSKVWTSVTGNQANPTGLASVLGSYISSATTAGTTGSTTTAGDTSGSSTSSGGVMNWLANVLNGLTGQPQVSSATAGLLPSASGASGLFARGGTIILGVVIVMVAAYALLVQQNIAPSPREIVRAI